MDTYIEHKNRVKELLIEIKENLEPEPTSECCIYRVPKDIRRMNEAAYTPQLISIGPLHRDNEELAAMDNQKRRYVRSFLDRIPAEKEDQILSFVQDNERRIRECYEESIQLDTPEFIMMIVCDALFIIELFLRDNDRDRHREDTLLDQLTTIKYALILDLQLLENQLPYFILDEICKIAYATPRFFDLSKHFFRCSMFRNSPHDQTVVKHFTDLTRRALVESCPQVGGRGKIKDLPCAVKLRESGVKFKSIKGEGLLTVTLVERRSWLVPFLKVHELHIPCFEIYDSTECRLRNIMAWEQCCYPSDTRVCNYVSLMDSLINTEKDVDLLVGKGIISNLLGDNAQVANMFNSLGSHIVLDENACYYDICEKLKADCNNHWNKTRATLKKVYFNHRWKGTATVAAVILLVLSVIQTVCSILQVK